VNYLPNYPESDSGNSSRGAPSRVLPVASGISPVAGRSQLDLPRLASILLTHGYDSTRV
jgi:hypothetical protein